MLAGTLSLFGVEGELIIGEGVCDDHHVFGGGYWVGYVDRAVGGCVLDFEGFPGDTVVAHEDEVVDDVGVASGEEDEVVVALGRVVGTTEVFSPVLFVGVEEVGDLLEWVGHGYGSIGVVE